MSKTNTTNDAYVSMETPEVITWCAGCGNYSIENAIRRAIVAEGLSPTEDIIVCYDVGCSGNGSDKIQLNTIHGLHGRVLPLSAGVKSAQHNRMVIAHAGDGATFSEGVGHLVHAVRNQYPIVFIHHNNHNYGLTTGQASALSPPDARRSGAPHGAGAPTINPVQMALDLGASYVARTCSADTAHTAATIQTAIQHVQSGGGFAFVDVVQSCPTYCREMPSSWYLQRMWYLTGDGQPDSSAASLTVSGEVQTMEHDATDQAASRALALRSEHDVIAMGILHHNRDLPSFFQQQKNRTDWSKELWQEVEKVDVSQHFADL